MNKSLFIAALLSVASVASAQETFLFEGRVVNSSGIPIKDVTVSSPKLNVSMTTGYDGIFTLKLPVNADSISFAKEGMETYYDELVSQYKIVVVLEPLNSSCMAYSTYAKKMEGTAKLYYEAGLKFLAGEGNAEPDYMKAYASFSRAANMENHQAAYLLGKMYEEGQGIPQDYEKAIKWYEKALDNPEANVRLGLMYSGGTGVEQNYLTAAKYFFRAVNQGDTIRAKKYMEDIFAKGLADKDEIVIYEVVEKNAQFPGGEDECYKWLARNVRYPRRAQEIGAQGRVFVSFVVGRDGSIGDVSVTRSPDPSLSKEAIRVVSLMPKWEPATQGQKKVRSRFLLPIMFRLR